ncbi:MAG: hypothetical protein M1829_003912 [Trizodia sp. TS-e1964]|nr:MAG: hypothetical protein M1829_003912 [Trizodia sp. TS-e1964]
MISTPTLGKRRGRRKGGGNAIWLPPLLFLLALCTTHLAALPIPQTQTSGPMQIEPPVPAPVPGSSMASGTPLAPANGGSEKPTGTDAGTGTGAGTSAVPTPSGPLQDQPPAPSVLPASTEPFAPAQPAALNPQPNPQPSPQPNNPQSAPPPAPEQAAASPKLASAPTPPPTCPDPFKPTLNPLQYGRQFMGTDVPSPAHSPSPLPGISVTNDPQQVHYAAGARCPSEEEADPARHFSDYRGAARNAALGFDVLVSSLLAAANALGGKGDVAVVSDRLGPVDGAAGEGGQLAVQLEGLLAGGGGARQGVAEWFLALLARLAARIGSGIA